MEQRINRRESRGRKRRNRRIRRRIARDVFLCTAAVALIGIPFLAVRIIQYFGAGEAVEANLSSYHAEEYATEEQREREKLTRTLKEKGYPESLIELYEKHPETKKFVLGYMENKDKPLDIDIRQEVRGDGIPLFLQWDERWGYQQYGDDFMAVTACGPVCLSMVRCGLSKDSLWNPYEVARMADKEGFYVPGEGSQWSLMTLGAESIGLTAYEVSYDADSIEAELMAGHPIICVVGPGDFTTTGHFIVLAASDGNGGITVRDPNSIVNSEKAWRIEDIMPQIRNLWGYSLQ